jgi:[histone H4]-N-methyl-L-lysine20 N-methyltransferase
MSRYLELYLPTGSIEITQTSRYSHKTGKSELCVIAVKPLKAGQTITDLKGKFPFFLLFWIVFSVIEQP